MTKDERITTIQRDITRIEKAKQLKLKTNISDSDKEQIDNMNKHLSRLNNELNVLLTSPTEIKYKFNLLTGKRIY